MVKTRQSNKEVSFVDADFEDSDYVEELDSDYDTSEDL